MQQVQGWVEQGAVTVKTSGIVSQTKVQGSFPGAAVEVVLHTQSPLDLVSIVRSANVVTVTMAPGFGFIMGNLVTIAGVTDISFDGVFVILSVGATTFTYAQTGTNASSSSGTATAVQLATIYSDDVGTVKANPFTADVTGRWGFFAANGVYDITFSGGGLAAIYTLDSVPIGGGGGGVPSFAFANLPVSAARNAGDLARVTDTTGGLWMDSGTEWVKVAPVQVNVRDAPFNAAGDGSTDDTVAIQAAINAVSPLTTISPGGTEADARKYGGRVFLPKGLYKVTDTLTIPSQVILEGEGGIDMFNANFTTSTFCPSSVILYVPGTNSHAALSLNGYVAATGALIPADGSFNNTNIGTGISNGTYIAKQGAGVKNLGIYAPIGLTAVQGICLLGGTLSRIENVFLINFQNGIRHQAAWNSTYEGIYISNYSGIGMYLFDGAENITLRKGWIHGGANTGNECINSGYVTVDCTGFQLESSDIGWRIIDSTGANNIRFTGALEVRNYGFVSGQFASPHLTIQNSNWTSTPNTGILLDSNVSGPDGDFIISNVGWTGISRILGPNMTGAGVRGDISFTALGPNDNLFTGVASGSPIRYWRDANTETIPGTGQTTRTHQLASAASIREAYTFAGTLQHDFIHTNDGIEVRDASSNLLFKFHTTAPYSIEFALDPKLIAESGAPGGVYSAPVGSVYLRSDGGLQSAMYLKVAGTGNSGWVPVQEGGEGSVITASATITLGNEGFFLVNGNTGITAITAQAAGRKVTLQFSGTPTVTAGGNLALNGNFVAGASGQSTLSLVSDGTNWVEVARNTH